MTEGEHTHMSELETSKTGTSSRAIEPLSNLLFSID